jgi:hypothetical protein
MGDSQAIGFQASSICKSLGDPFRRYFCLENAPTQQWMTFINLPKTSFRGCHMGASVVSEFNILQIVWDLFRRDYLSGKSANTTIKHNV